MLVVGKRSKLANLDLKCSLARSNNQILKAELRGSAKGVQLAVDAMKELQGIKSDILKQDPDYHLTTALEIVELMERAFGVIETGQLISAQRPELLRIIPENLEHFVHKYILSTLQDSIQLTVDFPENFNSLRQVNALRDIHVKLAKYGFDSLDRHVQEDMEDFETRDQRSELQEIIVAALFDSLRYESEEGQKLFPSILRFKKEARLKQLFIKKCREVPVAMFLKSIPQLFSHLNFEKENYLDDLMLRIAKEYPMALYFPFRMSYDQYKFQYSNTEDRTMIKSIREAIYDPKMEKLVKGLSTVCLPQVMFTAHVTNLLRTLKIKQGDELKELLRRTIDILLPEDDQMRGRQFRDYERGSLKKKLTDLLDYDDGELNVD